MAASRPGFGGEKQRRDSWKAQSDSRNASLGQRARAMKTTLEKKQAEAEKRLRKLTEEPSATKTIGRKGGSVGITGHGVKMKIPPGALKGDQDIKVQILGEELPETSTAGVSDEFSLCPSVRCTPSGLTFKEPIRLTFNHCAELTEKVLAGEGDLVLYWREKGEDEEEGEGDENRETNSAAKGEEATAHAITKEQLVPPMCKFEKDKIHVYVKHFSDFWVRIKSFFSSGKRVGCLPFLPMEMPITRKPILRCYVYDLTEGHKERIKDEEFSLEFRNPTPESQLLVKGNRKDLHILVKDNKGVEHKVNLDYLKIVKLDRNVVYVELDYTDKEDNSMEVDINVNQGEEKKSRFDETVIQVRTVLQETRRQSVVSLSSIPDLQEPEPDVTIVKKKLSERLDDEFLMTLAEEIETDELLESLMTALKIGPAAQRRCFDTNRCEGKVTIKGTRDMLFTWRAKTEVSKQRTRLKKALSKALLLDLRDRLFADD